MWFLFYKKELIVDFRGKGATWLKKNDFASYSWTESEEVIQERCLGTSELHWGIFSRYGLEIEIRIRNKNSSLH